MSSTAAPQGDTLPQSADQGRVVRPNMQSRPTETVVVDMPNGDAPPRNFLTQQYYLVNGHALDAYQRRRAQGGPTFQALKFCAVFAVLVFYCYIISLGISCIMVLITDEKDVKTVKCDGEDAGQKTWELLIAYVVFFWMQWIFLPMCTQMICPRFIRPHDTTDDQDKYTNLEEQKESQAIAAGQPDTPQEEMNGFLCFTLQFVVGMGHVITTVYIMHIVFSVSEECENAFRDTAEDFWYVLCTVTYYNVVFINLVFAVLVTWCCLMMLLPPRAQPVLVLSPEVRRLNVAV